jgi:hypothetical protein
MSRLNEHKVDMRMTTYMKDLRTPLRLLFLVATISIVNGSFALAQEAVSSLPRIGKNGSATQLFVDGKPYIMLAGELHNSSASSVEYMAPLWDKLAAMHLNTVISTVSWELTEPEEGKFDFTLVDSQIAEAHLVRFVEERRIYLRPHVGQGESSTLSPAEQERTGFHQLHRYGDVEATARSSAQPFRRDHDGCRRKSISSVDAPY